jgi:alkanesulfonate monooxygenase SsuD/methylene tetrahydromethanopterin reductase-like flavin-dependent oxidoreductase (luciferase family)
MHYGVVMFPTEYAIAPDELARALESAASNRSGSREHTHIPASRLSPWPGGGDLPRDYWSSYDPFVALMAAGAATKRLKLGYRHLPRHRARSDHAREGKSRRSIGCRVAVCSSGLAGAGTGRDEQSFDRMEVAAGASCVTGMLAMKEIWTKREAEFHGEFVNFEKIWSDPKPVQKPHPPILIGGDARRRSIASWSTATLDADHAAQDESPRAHSRAARNG